MKDWYHWFGVIATHLGPDYEAVEAAELMQMRLIVFAKKSLRGEIKDIETAVEATGILHVVGNKGGLVVRFSCRDTTFAFVSCHLAAHEGEQYRNARNDNCREVLEGARVGIPQMDIVPQTDHVFWMGDLNYRLDPYRFGFMSLPDPSKDKDHQTLPKSGTPEHKEVWDKIQELIAAEDWEELAKHDELREELQKKHVLSGFEEGVPNFPPTFKVLALKKLQKKWDEGSLEPAKHPLMWTEQRWPSYTDRVLWHSHPTKLGDVTQMDLRNVPEALTSDHKPVQSLFSIMLRPKPTLLPVKQPAEAPEIWISGLEGHDGIKAMDATGKSDPYIFFYCPELGIDFDPENPAKQFVTAIKNQTLNPKWDDSEIPTLPCMTADKDVLKNSHLMLCMQDFDSLNPDDDMGFACINLGPFIEDEGDFNAAIVLQGQQAGWVKGHIKMAWPEDGVRQKREFQGGGGCECIVS